MIPRLILTSVAIVVLALSAHAHPGEVAGSFEAPGRFCTGMTFDGTRLWIADYKTDLLYVVDPETGKVGASIPSPGFWPMGLAFDGETLWNVDGGQKMIFQVDPSTGRVLKAIESPSDNPEGLAWDGNSLWVSDYRARKIMKIDLTDGTAVKTLAAPARSPDGLAFDGTYLWCSDRLSDEIYMIDPESGDVLVIIDAPGPYARGLAFDGTHLWNVDHQTDTVYALVRQDDELFRLEDTRRAAVTLTHEVKVYGKGSVNTLDVFIAVSDEMPQQKILGWEAASSFEGTLSREKDRWNQEVAVFRYETIPPETSVETVTTVEAEISAIRYFIFPDRCGTLGDIPRDIRETYTADGTKYMTGDPAIAETAAELAGEERNPYYIMRRMFDHVRGAMEYKLEGGWNAAPVVLERGTGSCSEYTFAFVALCRAAGLPARYVGALVVRGDDASLDNTFHRWPEVYLPGYGWVPVDPQAGDKASPRDRAMAIGNLSNRFLITTQGGGDSEFLGWTYNYHHTYTMDPQVEVNIETFAEWEPLDNINDN